MTEDRFDSLIDDVAKEMTSTPYDTRFVETVSLRIADDGVRRRAWLQPWVLVPAMSACALMLTVFVMRERRAPVAVAQPASSVVRLKPDTASRVRPNATSPMPGPVRTAVARKLPPLARLRVEPIDVDPLVLQPLVEPQQIEIRAIAIDRIDIAPMP